MNKDGMNKFDQDPMGKVTLADILIGASLGILALSMMWFSSSLMIHLIR